MTPSRCSAACFVVFLACGGDIDPGPSSSDGDGGTPGDDGGAPGDDGGPAPDPNDPDGDGLSNDCERDGGTDPDDADTDGDGVPDGAEDSNHTCEQEDGETDPTNPDSDGDGVDDGSEARIGTDPLADDSDEDRVGDGEEPGALVCTPDTVVQPQIVKDREAAYQIALTPSQVHTALDFPDPAVQGGLVDDDDGVELAAFVLSLPPLAPSVGGDPADEVGPISTAMQAMPGVSTIAMSFSGRPVTAVDGVLLRAGIRVDVGMAAGTTSHALRAAVIAAVTGIAAADVPGLDAPGGTAGTDFVVTLAVYYRDDRQMLVVGAVAHAADYDDRASATRIRAADLTNGTPLVGLEWDIDIVCESTISEGAGEVDFVWSVDDSASMENELRNLRANVPVFTDILTSSGVDFRLARSFHTCDVGTFRNATWTTRCTDGVMNFDETDVDCGGPECMPCEMSEEARALVRRDELAGTDRHCAGYKAEATFGWKNGALFDGTLTADATDDYPGFTSDVDLFSVAAGFDRSAGVGGGGGGFDNDPNEYTLSAGLLAIDRALATGDTSEYGIRPGAAAVLVVVADEADEAFERELAAVHDATFPANAQQVADLATMADPYITWFVDRGVLVFGIVHRNEDDVGEERENCVRRVAEGTGGTTGPLGHDGDDPEEMRPVLEEIVIAAIGAASRLELSERPVSLSLKVAAGHPGEVAHGVPRSLVNGFDYDPQFNRLTFYGDEVPEDGDDVAVSYRVWRPRIPDLVVPSLEADLFECPGSITLTATVQNVGSQGVDAGVVVSFYDGDAADPGALIDVAELPVPLDPNESTRVSVDWAIPPGRENDVFSFLAVVDDDGTGAGVVVERDETNNTAALDDVACDLIE